MTNYYVSVNGSDLNDGTTIGSAWEHPSYASLQAVAGDVINILDDGVYENEHVYFQNSGTPGNPITMRAYNGNPTFDGLDGTGTGIMVGFYKGYYDPREWITVEGLTVKNYDMQIMTRKGTGMRILNCTAYPNSALTPDGNPGGIGISEGCNNCSIEGCTVIGNAWNSIQLAGTYYSGGAWYSNPSSNLTVRNCIVHSNTLHCSIDCLGSVNNILIENNTLGRMSEDNGIGFFNHQGNIDGITIRNNRFINCAYNIDSQAIFLLNAKNAIVENNYIEHSSSGMKVSNQTYDQDHFPENITIRNNEIHDMAHYGIFVYPTGLNILLDQNSIYDTGLVEIRAGSPIKILNQTDDSFSVQAYNSVDVTVEFNDGRSFSVDGEGNYTTFIIVDNTPAILVIGSSPPPPPPPVQTICSWIEETGISNLQVAHALYSYYLSAGYTSLAEGKYVGLDPQPQRLDPENASFGNSLGIYYYGMGYNNLGNTRTGCSF